MIRKVSIIGIIILISLVIGAILSIAENDTGKTRRYKKSEWNEMIKDMDRQMAFYGKVIDQNNAPVVDAQVEIGTNSSSGDKNFVLTTDNQGRFKLITEIGFYVDVHKVIKKGYEYTFSDNRNSGFDYAAEFEKDRHHPDPSNPVIFKMRKKEPPTLVIPFPFKFGAGINKKVVEQEVDLLMRAAGRSGFVKYSEGDLGHIDLLVKAEMLEGNAGFRVTFKTPDADSGVMERDELLYVTPADGYKSPFSITVPPDVKQGKKYLYVKSRKGKVHARLDIELNSGKEGIGVSVKSWANPTGSRNVDYDPELMSQELDRRNAEDKRKIIENEEQKKKHKQSKER